jgi:hypothetical protein
MRLVFERGDERSPKGHALIYFRDTDSQGVLATYLVIPPITIDFSKYLPPMFAGQGMAANLAEASSIVPLPPVPEAVASLQQLEVLAQQRDDDLVLAGDATAGQVEQLLTYTTEAAQLYFHLYQDYSRTFPETPALETTEVSIEGPSAEELTFALMGERERLGELSKLTGALRYAVDGSDQNLADETAAKMRLLAKHMPAKYWAEKVIDAASKPSEAGGQLTQLYLDRCYKLLEEDYSSVAKLEEEISAIGERP